MITQSKAVEEVWKWREEIGEEIKDMTSKEQVAYFNESGRKLCKEFGLKYPENTEVHAR